MKGMKGKLLKKLKTVKQIGYVNSDRILQVSALDGFVDNFHFKSTFVDNFPFKSHTKSQPKTNKHDPEKITKEDFKDEEISTKDCFNDKENIRPSISKDVVCDEILSCCSDKSKKQSDSDIGLSSSYCEELKEQSGYDIGLSSSYCEELKEQIDSDIGLSSSYFEEELKEKYDSVKIEIISGCCNDLEEETDSEFKVLSFRRPDMDSGSLFDPKLLAAFKEAVEEYLKTKEAAKFEGNNKDYKYPFFQPEDETMELLDESNNPLEEFEEKCPPNGKDSVILYTTSVRGIRKTFEDCQSIRFLLESFGLVYYERDVSIHSGFRDELWKVMGDKCLPPRLFIRGRYIGGAEKVLTLNEQGRLRGLFRDIPMNFSEGPCNVCCGLRFMLCYNCNGSRKVFEFDGEEEGCSGNNEGFWSKCLQCNENGLVVCPLC